MTPEVNAIKDEIRACRSIPEVDHVARKHGAAVSDMMDSPTLYVMAVQIRNLARYQRVILTPLKGA